MAWHVQEFPDEKLYKNRCIIQFIFKKRSKQLYVDNFQSNSTNYHTIPVVNDDNRTGN